MEKSAFGGFGIQVEVTKAWWSPRLRRAALARQSHVQLAGLPTMVLVVGWKQLCPFVDLDPAMLVHIPSLASSANGPRGATLISNSSNWPANLRLNCVPYHSTMTIFQPCSIEVLWQSCMLTQRPTCPGTPDTPPVTIPQNWNLTVVLETVLWAAFSPSLP